MKESPTVSINLTTEQRKALEPLYVLADTASLEGLKGVIMGQAREEANGLEQQLKRTRAGYKGAIVSIKKRMAVK